MIRKINFTERKKITKGMAQVTLKTDKHPFSFDIQLDFSKLDLPQNASVFVEAYKRASYMRFPFGYAGTIKIPSVRTLTNFDQGVTPLFRVKVVDNTKRQGRIIALADKIVPKGGDQGRQEEISLLHIEYSMDLGNQIWRLDLDSDWPTLQLNGQVENIKDKVNSDPGFSSLVFPDLVRQILKSIVSEDFDPDENIDDWPSLWVKLVSHLPGVGSLPTEGNVKAEQKEWVEKAVEAFCDNQSYLAKYNKLLSGAGD